MEIAISERAELDPTLLLTRNDTDPPETQYNFSSFNSPLDLVL